MNKKLFLLGSFLLVSSAALQACRLKVSNDTDKTVIFQSFKETKDRLELQPGQKNVPFGKQDGEKGEMAEFELSIVGSDTKPIRVVQTLCSKDFNTHLNVSEIVNHKFSDTNAKLYTFENVKAGECGCPNKK